MYIVLGGLMILIGSIVVFFFLGMFRTWQVQHGKKNKEFCAGKVPNPQPQGFYKGFAQGYVGPWIGKTFQKDTQTGTNDFSLGKRDIKQFPFKTYGGNGLQDKKLSVLKIDYNIPENPFFIRMILDEIVEIEKNYYLGKIHIKLFPLIPFTLGYFTLRQEKK